MKTTSVRKTLLGVMCAGVLGYGAGAAQAQQPAGNPGTTKPGTVSPNTEDPNRNPNPIPGSPTNPMDPTAPGNPASPAGTTAEPTQRAPSAEPVRMETEKLAPADMKQIKTATQKLRTVNATEIEAGQLAQEKGASDAVKDFGRKLVEDHQAADKKLVDFAKKHDIMLTGTGERPASSTGTGSESGSAAGTGAAGTTGSAENPAPAPLDAEGKKMISKLSAAEGAKFDKLFTSTMVSGHQKALSFIKSSKSKIKNEEFDSVLSDIQSSVEQHLDHAKQLSGKGAQSSSTPDEPTQTHQGHRPVSTPPPEPTPTP